MTTIYSESEGRAVEHCRATIKHLLIEMREKLDDDNARTLLDSVLDRIEKMKQGEGDLSGCLELT